MKTNSENKPKLDDKEFLSLLGTKIKEIRQNQFAGMSDLDSQSQFASAVGINLDKLALAEKGEGIDTLLLHKISDCFSIPFDDFFIKIDKARQDKSVVGANPIANEVIEASIAHSPRTMAKLGHSVFPKESGDRKDIVGEEKDRDE